VAPLAEIGGRESDDKEDPVVVMRRVVAWV